MSIGRGVLSRDDVIFRRDRRRRGGTAFQAIFRRLSASFGEIFRFRHLPQSIPHFAGIRSILGDASDGRPRRLAAVSVKLQCSHRCRCTEVAGAMATAGQNGRRDPAGHRPRVRVGPRVREPSVGRGVGRRRWRRSPCRRPRTRRHGVGGIRRRRRQPERSTLRGRTCAPKRRSRPRIRRAPSARSPRATPTRLASTSGLVRGVVRSSWPPPCVGAPLGKSACRASGLICGAAVTVALDPTGQCYRFSDTCIPIGWREVDVQHQTPSCSTAPVTYCDT